MRTQGVGIEIDVPAAGIYHAGQKVPPGTYCQLESGREVHLDQEDILPGTCDGHTAVYQRRQETWGERQKSEGV